MTLNYPLHFTYNEAIRSFFIENKIFLKHAFKVDGAYKIGDPIKIHAQTNIERYSTMPPKQFLCMGAYSYCMSTGLDIDVSIGRYSSIAKNVRIMGIDHPTNWISTHVFPFRWYATRFAKEEFGVDFDVQEYEHVKQPVHIGNDVWIGQDVLLRRGITIGDGAIIGAGSVVTKNVAPYTIVAGAPATFRKPRFSDEIVARLGKIKWWDYNFPDFHGMDLTNPLAFLDALQERIENKTIAPFQPGHIDIGSALQNMQGPQSE